MALHLITGYAGMEHITSADQGAYNSATFGSGEFVLDRGQKFAYTILSNNAIQIADGEAMMQGRFIKMSSGTTEELTITNGTQGKKRNDLICIRYEKSAADSTESTKFVVVKGEDADSNPADPEYTHGSITDGDDTVNEMPLYRVSLDGININSVTPLFSVKVSMSKYMDSYQLEPATSSKLGGIKVGSGLAVSNDGTLRNTYSYTLPAASADVLGGVKAGGPVRIINGQISLKYVQDNVYAKTNVTIPAHSSKRVHIDRINCYTLTLGRTSEGAYICEPCFFTTPTDHILIDYVIIHNLSSSSITINTDEAICVAAYIPFS